MKGKELKYRADHLILFETIYLCLGMFYAGYSMAVLNQSQSCIEIVNNWSFSQKTLYSSLLTSFLPLGAILGSILTIRISNKKGKRVSLLIFDLLGIIGSFMMVFTGASLFIGRFITGLVTGANTLTVSSYISELSPNFLLARMSAVVSIMMNFGVFFAFLLGLNFPTEAYMQHYKDELHWWRFMMAYPIITCVIRLIVLIFFIRTDTPTYYLSQNRDEEAKTVLRKYYLDVNVENIFKDLKQKHDSEDKATYRDLVGHKYSKRFVIGIFVSLFQQFLGINSVIFYSKHILMRNNGNDYHAKIATAIIGVLLIITSYFSGTLLEKLGRRTILIYGQLVCSLMLLFLCLFGFVGYEAPTKYVILLYIIGYGLSMGHVVFVYIQEILPEKGVLITIIVNWFAIFTIGLVFPVMVGWMEIEGTFMIFFVISIIGLIYMKFNLLETHHKTKEAVEEMFMTEQNMEEGKENKESIETDFNETKEKDDFSLEMTTENKD